MACVEWWDVEYAVFEPRHEEAWRGGDLFVATLLGRALGMIDDFKTGVNLPLDLEIFEIMKHES